MEIIDISLGIHKYMLFYPGDPEFQITRVYDIKNGDSITLSTIKMGTHTGTHIDSPLHFLKEGLSISDIDLKNFYGTCHVLDFTHIKFEDNIRREDLLDIEFQLDLIILFKTLNSSILEDKFQEDFVSLTKEAADFLVSTGIKAVGIDYLSIGDQETHKSLLSEGIVVYEGLNLSLVNPGVYTFIGFPIKLLESEGAPTRAVLLKE